MSEKKLIIFTDAWEPQVNGVVFTLKNVIKCCKTCDINVIVVSPNKFKYKFPLPTYKEILIPITTRKKIKRIIEQEKPDYIHIATEGVLGLLASMVCKKFSIPYTTSFHTRFPEYINSRYRFVSVKRVYDILRKVHNTSETILATTESMKEELLKNDFPNRIRVWSRGIDKNIFFYEEKTKKDKVVLLNVGRVSIEKNLEEFLDLDIKQVNGLPVEKRIVGDGPLFNTLSEKYKEQENIIFTGVKHGADLGEEYRNADVFVFPSKSDTFGLVQIESMACGTPVAAYDVIGPKDVITNKVNGYLSEDLQLSINECITIDRKACSDSVSKYNWEEVNRTFTNCLVQIKEKI